MSETSTDRDVSMIMNHSILSEDDFFVHQKRREQPKLEIIRSKMIDSDSYVASVDLLKRGFYAIKYNYSNDKV